MPERITRIVDAHVHWWDVEKNPWYEFIRNVAEATGTDLHSNYLPADYRRAIGKAEVAKVVHVSAVVQTQRYVDELRWLNGVATTSGFEVGCVGSVDPALSRDELRAHLDAQYEVGRLRGIRVIGGLDPSADAAGTLADWLIQRDLVFDLVAHPDTLGRWTQFVAERPQLRVVLEHTGWPLGVDEASYEAWNGSMAEFARSTDATVKLSGLAMVTREISAASMGPWIECCIGLFGWDRVVFGSNFPLDGLFGSYEELLRVFDEVLKSARDEQLEKLFAANAERIYRV
jgi:L-fuconolactonase